MRRTLPRGWRWWLLAALLATVVAAPAGPAHAAPDRLVTGLQDLQDSAFGDPDPNGAFRAARAAGIRIDHIPVPWSNRAQTEPAHPEDANDPAYNWAPTDERVKTAKQFGMDPMLVLYTTPHWARTTRNGHPINAPRPAAYAAFAKAAARHYDGKHGVPRVKYWEAFNEANLGYFMDQSDPVPIYRAMVNGAYKSIHSAVASNVVVAGALGPFAGVKGQSTKPLQFMADLLCVSNTSHPHKTCGKHVSFDAWSHHPYTSGGPTHKAFHAGDVSLGDLPKMRRLLRAGVKTHHINSRGKVGFWATEFSWDTKGPDPGGVPLSTHARWVAEALYRMWQNDISVVIWFQLRDNPKGADWGKSWQSGLYFRTTTFYRNEKAKPALAVIRFPFVALPGKRATIWGRTPDSKRHFVLIQKRSGKKWRKVARLKSNKHGIFRLRKRKLNGKTLRARVGKRSSRPYKVVRNKDIPVNAFGGNGPLH